MIAKCLLVLLAVAFTLPAPAGAQEAQPKAVAVDGFDYPRITRLDEGTVTVHHPQIDSWEDFERISAWVVVEVEPTGTDKIWIGSVRFEAQTDIDFDERLVIVHDIEAVDRRFEGDTPPEEVLNIARRAISLKPRSIPLDILVRSLPEDFEPPSRGTPPDLKFDPPKIFVSTTPAALMIINGEPVKAPVEGTDLEFVVNTNWDLFYDTEGETWYVLNDGAWQRSDSLQAEWQFTRDLPSDFKKIPNDDNWTEVWREIPAKQPEKEPPPIIVSLEPAELLLLDGDPKLQPIPSAEGLAFVDNTTSDLFVYQDDYYFLISGRWFKADSLSGDWTPVEDLPAAFAGIPHGHLKAHVLASVPNTVEARAAVIEAQIPREANISRDAGAELQVAYGGDPQFVAIEGTSLQRAANTSSQVIRYGDKYYLCENAAWFVSDTAHGPWTLATEIPAEIYDIPASDPTHNVTYVYVVENNPSKVHVTYGYTSGYYGTYWTSGSVVFGTGYYYNPWVYYPPYGYPYYGYYPYSYGYGARYNPATGFYGRGAVAYGPYGGAASAAVYNPQTGTYGRGWSAWDGDEVARSGYAFNPRTNTSAAGNMYYDYDDNKGWREGYVERGDRWAYSEADIDGNTVRSQFETSRGVTGTSTRQSDGNTMTGQGTVQYGDRSATTESRVDQNTANLSIRGDQGGSVDFSKDRGQPGSDLSGTTAGGRDFEGSTQMTRQGRVTGLEGDGGQALFSSRGDDISMLGRSASGDLYAGRNGNVYRRSDDGWHHYSNGSWQSTSRNRSGSQYSRDASSLNRQHYARQSGSRNYSQYRSQRSSMQRRGGTGGRRGGRRR